MPESQSAHFPISPGRSPSEAKKDYGYSPRPNALITFLSRLSAACFLAAIVLTPVCIVLIWHNGGTVWVAGYLVGIATVPLVAFAALRAVNSLFGEERLLVAFVLFSALVVAASIGSIVYGLV